MNSTTCKSTFLRTLARVSALSVLFLSTGAQASSIFYGDFGPVPPGFTFTGVTESSGTDGVPLYGPPTPFANGLDFDPANFVSAAAGGSVDLTDGQLNFSVVANPGLGIGSISLFEGGDYTLSGLGTAATQASVGAIMRVSVSQINGVDVAPIVLPSSSVSVAFDLVANPGVIQPWSLAIFGYDIAGQLAPGQVATKVDVVINNQLLTVSEAASLALIAKKDFVIQIVPVPEPAAWLLAAPALAAVFAVGRRVKRGRTAQR